MNWEFDLENWVHGTASGKSDSSDKTPTEKRRIANPMTPIKIRMTVARTAGMASVLGLVAAGGACLVVAIPEAGASSFACPAPTPAIAAAITPLAS